MRGFPRGCERVGTEVEILTDLPRLRINLAERPLNRALFLVFFCLLALLLPTDQTLLESIRALSA